MNAAEVVPGLAAPLPEPACGAGMWARRIAIMGVDPDAAGLTADRWPAPVMVLAGRGEHGEPWLWVACRACGWFLGFAPLHSPAELAEAAGQHDGGCEAIAAERVAAGAVPGSLVGPELSARAGLICPGCGSGKFALQLGGVASGAIRCEGCGLVLDQGGGP